MNGSQNSSRTNKIYKCFLKCSLESVFVNGMFPKITVLSFLSFFFFYFSVNQLITKRNCVAVKLNTCISIFLTSIIGRSKINVYYKKIKKLNIFIFFYHFFLVKKSVKNIKMFIALFVLPVQFMFNLLNMDVSRAWGV